MIIVRMVVIPGFRTQESKPKFSSCDKNHARTIDHTPDHCSDPSLRGTLEVEIDVDYLHTSVRSVGGIQGDEDLRRREVT